jgi:hypothetical protein
MSATALIGDKIGGDEIGIPHCASEHRERGAALVQRIFGGVSQPLDLILHHEFSALQFYYLQVVR